MNEQEMEMIMTKSGNELLEQKVEMNCSIKYVKVDRAKVKMDKQKVDSGKQK